MTRNLVMSHTTLTADAKTALRRTIGRLREELLVAFRETAETAYMLAISVKAARLREAPRERRKRLEAWVEEQIRAVPEPERKKAKDGELRERFVAQSVKEAASTFLNRMILLRIMEAMSAGKPRAERLVAHDVITKGWMSPAYKEFREYAPALCEDKSLGYSTLLELVFAELALDLPGLFGNVGLTRLFPIPPAMLRLVVDALNEPALASAWTDDTTLGWVYQYWNDPDREALDAKINAGGKIEPHEIASKTQMFTERYMVEWLLQNSLGLQWLAICKQHGWTPDAESVLGDLDRRRGEWRALRDKGEVPLDALMPISGELEEHWKYYVPQPIPADMVEKVTGSVTKLKILDPACGSGHFLVIAFDLLVALYKEEARHTGQAWSNKDIAESIVEINLHGVDIDPRAVQIAAAGLFVKARAFAPDMRVKRVNLVAPALRLARLPANDPALEALRKDLRAEAGIPSELTNTIIKSLAGVDHLGTLLKVDKAIEDALLAYERPHVIAPALTGDLFSRKFPSVQTALPLGGTRTTVLEKLEPFLARHAQENDLGLRLDGEQIAVGVRFIRLVKDSTYDLVIGNPPYQATTKMVGADYVKAVYPRAKADLYAAFLERALELARPSGISALLTMRGWMFLGQFQEIRKYLLEFCDLRSLGDVDRGAFDEVPNEVLAGVMSIFHKAAPLPGASVAMQPTPLADKSYDRERTNRKRAAVLAQNGRFEFSTTGLGTVSGAPVLYWWSQTFMDQYASAQKLGDVAPVRQGLITSDNLRFVRAIWEPARNSVFLSRTNTGRPLSLAWMPYIKGAAGQTWFEPATFAVNWALNGLEIKTFEVDGKVASRPQNESSYFALGVAFSPIGSIFSARCHRFSSIFDSMGSSVFSDDSRGACALMNSATARFVLESINPTVHFQVGDVNRLPIFPIKCSDEIYAFLDRAFTQHEAAREASVEFKHPGPSPWIYAQDWAQRSVDRPAGEPLPAYTPVLSPPTPADFLSYAVGVALGRFGAKGEGLLDAAPASALPAGILYISPSRRDSLGHPATSLLQTTWREQGRGDDEDLREWFRKDFFVDHKSRYENRPIVFPLSSTKKSFVALVAIHRFDDATLQTLLADWILPDRRTLEGEMTDLRQARITGSTDQKRQAERRFADVQKLVEELDDFLLKLNQCADKGAPPADKSTPRETDARYVMDLDDGVMVNSAGLWPLLEPQWKDPKKWWKELCNAAGKKDYDWSHLAARYFPARVDAKCKKDPSLGVAHGCFWRYHPTKAYAWELRLKDEIRPDFLIEEVDAAEHRARFVKDNPKLVAEILAKETARRERKKRKDEGPEQTEIPLDATDESEAEDNADA
ncbi:MAG: BREX-6 system adenine-specific DNA-methyltransferase PglX [Byssovorax sp.]